MVIEATTMHGISILIGVAVTTCTCVLIFWPRRPLPEAVAWPLAGQNIEDYELPDVEVDYLLTITKQPWLHPTDERFPARL